MGSARGSTNSVITVIFSTLFLLVIIVMIWYVAIPMIQYSLIDQCWGKFASDVGTLSVGMYTYGYKNVTLDFGDCATGLFFVNEGEQMEALKGITDDLQAQIEADRERNEETPDIPITDIIFSECDDQAQGHIIAVPFYGDTTKLGGPMYWIIGGALVGGWGGGKLAPIKRFARVTGVIGTATGILTATDLKKMIEDHFATIEERGKTAICISVGQPFAEDMMMFPSYEEVTSTGKFQPFSGDYCVSMFKGEENYFVSGWPGTCPENEDNIKGFVEEMKSN